jgi:hypothetical protein
VLHALSAGGTAEERRERLQGGGQLRQRVRTGFRDNMQSHKKEYNLHVHQGEYGEVALKKNILQS